MSKNKNKRLATLNNEWIEIDERGVMFLADRDGKVPADIYFVKDFFKSCRRVLDRSLLPKNTVLFPYGEVAEFPNCMALSMIRDFENNRQQGYEPMKWSLGRYWWW